MSVLWKISTNDRLLIKNGFQSICAYYSRRSKSNDIADKLVIIQLKKDENEGAIDEGGPNWELFNLKGNRFYLPNAVGPAYQNRKTVGRLSIELDELVDFNSKALDKFHFSSQECPALILEKIKEYFPIADTVITLSYQKEMDAEYAARNQRFETALAYAPSRFNKMMEKISRTEFVLAAGEICRRLNSDGFWADFWNPFSGKPFSGRHTKPALTDDSVYHFGIKYQILNNCTVIASDDSENFSGSIFTNAPFDSNEMKRNVELFRVKELLSLLNGSDKKDHF